MRAGVGEKYRRTLYFQLNFSANLKLLFKKMKSINEKFVNRLLNRQDWPTQNKQGMQ